MVCRIVDVLGIFPRRCQLVVSQSRQKSRERRLAKPGFFYQVAYANFAFANDPHNLETLAVGEW